MYCYRTNFYLNFVLGDSNSAAKLSQAVQLKIRVA